MISRRRSNRVRCVMGSRSDRRARERRAKRVDAYLSGSGLCAGCRSNMRALAWRYGLRRGDVRSLIASGVHASCLDTLAAPARDAYQRRN